MTRRKRPSYYVAVGASAGGLEAIEAFFKNTPADTGLAFVVLQHLSPDYRSMMVELLSKQTAMSVTHAEEGAMVESDRVYLMPPKKNLTITGGRLSLVDQDRHRGLLNLPIDLFLESLAEDQGEQGIAVILSGSGSDGSRGVRAIKAAGGMVMVQDAESAKFDGMPRAASGTGLADYVLPPAEMPAQLLAFVKHPYAPKKQSIPRALLTQEDSVTAVMEMIHAAYNVDFTHYKPKTLMRRIARRLSVSQMGDLATYVEHLRGHSDELYTLYQELLIGVTGFFRDRPVWDYLADTVVPALIESKEGGTLRLWSLGCSTGEETYGLAMLAREAVERSGKIMEVKVFGTDIDQEALVTAGNGVYPTSSMIDLPQTLVAKYFNQQDGMCTVTRGLREMVVFARQNLLADPPFTNIDVLCCRNLLIYLEPVLQRKAFAVFSFALRKDGILVLGKSEALGPEEESYETLDARLKVFSLKVRRNLLRDDHLSPDAGRGGPLRPAARRQGGRDGADDDLLDRLLGGLAGRFLPLTLVVDQTMGLQHVSGDPSGFFSLAGGRVTTDVIKLAHPDLAIPLATGLQKAMRDAAPLTYKNLRVRRGDAATLINLHIQPLPERRRGQPPAAAVVIEPLDEDAAALPPVATYDLDKLAQERIKDLEGELRPSSSLCPTVSCLMS